MDVSWQQTPVRFISSSPRQAKASASRALEIDTSLAEAHSSLAFLEFEADWDFKGAEEEFKQAIDLNPGYAAAHHWYAVLLSALGRHDEAMAEMERARRLDPLSPIINVNNPAGYPPPAARPRSGQSWRAQTALGGD
jgi:Tfp pilus assembly protein PilF